MSFGFHLSNKPIQILQNSFWACIHFPPQTCLSRFRKEQVQVRSAAGSPVRRPTQDLVVCSQGQTDDLPQRGFHCWTLTLSLYINSKRVMWPGAISKAEDRLSAAANSDSEGRRGLTWLSNEDFHLIKKNTVQCSCFCATTSHIIRRLRYRHHFNSGGAKCFCDFSLFSVRKMTSEGRKKVGRS